MKILIIEDEVKVARLIQQALKYNGFDSDIAYDGWLGKKLAMQNEYDVIVMDIILPKINGIDLCKIIREYNSQVPILMLTALNATEDVVNGLDSGANDYLTKPFKLEEFTARIRALGRISQNQQHQVVHSYADLRLNTASKAVFRGEDQISLTAKEFTLLEVLLKNKERVVSKAYISEKVWGSSYDVESNLVEVYINFLRNKIDKAYEPKLIHTMVGMGYVLKVND
jgi:two-component system, OmpR family, copper resistance phosphate regulon response regulator CusR